jgi:hypothetical protein
MARFVPNPAFRRELEAEPEFTKAMAEETVVIADAIKAAARRHRETGHYIREIESRESTIYLDPYFAHIIEYGTRRQSPQANVRLGVLAAGRRFVDDGPKQAD